MARICYRCVALVYVNIVSYTISTMVGWQAVQESFIIIEALPVRTQEVELGCVEFKKQSIRYTLDTGHNIMFTIWWTLLPRCMHLALLNPTEIEPLCRC